LGIWPSFAKTDILFIQIGAIFGVAKSFRDFKGQLWFVTEKDNRVKMTLIANLCLIPGWIIFFFRYSWGDGLTQSSVTAYIFSAFQYSVTYFVLFGVLPSYLFKKMELVRKDETFEYETDEDDVYYSI
jgi:hypothetical protein